MIRGRGSALQGADGFTLVEMLVALLLLGLVVGSLAAISAQWLPNWRHGLVRARSAEKIAIALDRMVSDLSAAQYVSMSRRNRIPLFQGDEQSVTFVRSALGPNSSRGLEIVRIAEITDSRGPALVRMRAPFAPRADGDLSIAKIQFADPVILLRSPLHIVFGYARNDGKWLRTWPYAAILPNAVRFVVLNDDGGRTVLTSTATRIHADIMVPETGLADETAPTTSASANGPGATQ